MIDANYFLTNTILMIIGTVSIRGFFIAFSKRMTISNKMRELFTFIPAAILPAIFVPATFFHQGHVDALFNKERFLVMLVCLVATYFYRHTLFCVALGLGLLFLIQSFAP